MKRRLAAAQGVWRVVFRSFTGAAPLKRDLDAVGDKGRLRLPLLHRSGPIEAVPNATPRDAPMPSLPLLHRSGPIEATCSAPLSLTVVVFRSFTGAAPLKLVVVVPLGLRVAMSSAPSPERPH